MNKPKPIHVLRDCSKKFPNMKRGKFKASDCTRMLCDFNPRLKILKSLIESVGGFHSSGVCDAHSQVMRDWMNGCIEVVFPDGSPLKEVKKKNNDFEEIKRQILLRVHNVDQKSETKEHPRVNDDCQKWRFDRYDNEKVRMLQAKLKNERTITEAKARGGKL